MKISREINKYTSLIIVLSVLLAISLVAGTTFAWFASSEKKATTISLGDPVVVNIAANSGGDILMDHEELPFVINNERLLPGMRINTFAAVKFRESTTPALLRVRLSVSVEGGAASQDEIRELAEELNNQIHTKASLVSYVGGDGDAIIPWIYDSSTGWWYYTEGQNDFSNVKNSTVKEIDCTLGPVVDFLNPYTKNQFLLLPSSIDNRFTSAKITFWFSVQAVQALIPASEEDPTGTYLETTIANVESVFTEAFAGSESNKDPITQS